MTSLYKPNIINNHAYCTITPQQMQLLITSLLIKIQFRVLDVVFNEDKSCIRNDNAAYNMDILRKWALNVLNNVKRKPSQSIKGLMRKNSMSIKHPLLLLNNYFHA